MMKIYGATVFSEIFWPKSYAVWVFFAFFEVPSIP